MEQFLKRRRQEDGWCLVVVGDAAQGRKGRISNTTTVSSSSSSSLVYLSRERQDELSKHFDLVKTMQGMNHPMAQTKNMAYLYAVANGAQSIWDFEDYNMRLLYSDEMLSRYTTTTTLDRTTVLTVRTTRNSTKCDVAHGYPLDNKIRDGECQFCIRSVKTRIIDQLSSHDGRTSRRWNPLGSYHPGRNAFLTMDVAKYKYKAVWIPKSKLTAAMATVDGCIIAIVGLPSRTRYTTARAVASWQYRHVCTSHGTS